MRIKPTRLCPYRYPVSDLMGSVFAYALEMARQMPPEREEAFERDKAKRLAAKAKRLAAKQW